MDGIEIMIEKRKNIKRMLRVMRKASLSIVNGEDINYDDFDKIIDFVNNYSSQDNYGKKEKNLFNRMMNEIGSTAENVIKLGVFMDHDFGGAYINELQKALCKAKNNDDEAKLDVVANTVCYANLLDRNIGKEDSYENFNDLNSSNSYKKIKKMDSKNKYIENLEFLEEKYSNVQ